MRDIFLKMTGEETPAPSAPVSESKPKLKLKMGKDKGKDSVKEEHRSGSTAPPSLSSGAKRKVSSSRPPPSGGGRGEGDGSPPASSSNPKKVKREPEATPPVSGLSQKRVKRESDARTDHPRSSNSGTRHRSEHPPTKREVRPDDRHGERSPTRNNHGLARDQDGHDRTSGRPSYDHASGSGEPHRSRWDRDDRDYRRSLDRRFERAPSDHPHHQKHRSSMASHRPSHSPPPARERHRSDVYNSLSTSGRSSSHHDSHRR